MTETSTATSPTSPPVAIRILVVDDHVLIRTALRLLFQTRPHLSVVGEAASAAEALEIAAREQPDIVLLDLDLGADSGLTLLGELHTVAAQARVIVLTGSRDVELHLRAISAGALGVVQKGDVAEPLLDAIEAVHGGEAWIDGALMAQVIKRMQGATPAARPDPEAEKIAALTAREREIIALASAGYKNHEIAARLFISEATARNHLTAIFKKLGVSERLELALYAYRHGLAEPPRPVNL